MTIPTLFDPSFAEFYTASEAYRRAVVVPGAVRAWLAIHRWTPASLKDRFGDVDAKVVRLSDGILTSDSKGGMREIGEMMSVGAFVDTLDSPSEGPATHYWRDVFSGGRLGSLADEVEVPTFIDRKRVKGFGLWVGAGGIKTALHHDLADNAFCQVMGTKHIRLYAPADARYLGADPDSRRYQTSPIDPFAPDLNAFPEFEQATPFDVVVGPGDLLFLPAGWWHHVTSVTQSISVNVLCLSTMELAQKMMLKSMRQAAAQ